jgi:MFS-type transporter involved in bile tolerance (Atg22 family)
MVVVTKEVFNAPIPIPSHPSSVQSFIISKLILNETLQRALRLGGTYSLRFNMFSTQLIIYTIRKRDIFGISR